MPDCWWSTESVCASVGDGFERSVAELVVALVDKSILIVDDRGPVLRYRMLETLREFGRERLDARGESAAVEQAHARHYVDLAWRAEVALRGPAEAEWVAILEAEVGNLRAAHGWALRTGNRAVSAELSAALVWFGYLRTRFDVLAWAEDLVNDELADGGPHLARALFAASMAALMRNEIDLARAVAERAVAVAPDETEQRWGRNMLGGAAVMEGRLGEAWELIDSALQLARDAGDHYHASHMLGALALTQSYAGEATAAIASAGACQLEAVRSGAPSALAFSAYALGEVLLGTDPDGALVHLDRAIALAASVGAHFSQGVALVSATSLRARHGDPPTAAAALLDVVEHWQRAGNWRQQWVTLRHVAEFLARVGDDVAAATLLGAIDAGDGNLFGADAERLATVRADLVTRLGPAAGAHFAEGGAMSAADLLVFTRGHLAAQLGDRHLAVGAADPRREARSGLDPRMTDSAVILR